LNDIILLNDLPYEGVINLPVFTINYLPSSVKLSSYDGIIFTSKNAIMAIDSFNTQWKEIPSYCIAPKTASVVSKYSGKVEFIGKSSHGDSFAKELFPLLKDKKMLYVRAKKTVSSLCNILSTKGITVEELIAYETVCQNINGKIANQNSVIIFSAPSTVKCFFNQFDWKESYKAVVIGKTTARYMPKEIPFVIADAPSVDSCVKLAQTL
jgi:uroporphyrinogen-III synthase